MAAKTTDMLGVYLNDHLAGSTVGLELARRIASSARHMPAPADTLKQFAAETAQDRAALVQIMSTLGVKVRDYKMFAAWAGEKLGRLKLNGYLLHRSPLSSLVELEAMRLGVEGKAAGWRTLRTLAERDSRLDAGRLDELIARATQQRDVLESIRASAAKRAFTELSG